jgi:hypothetical protein
VGTLRIAIALIVILSFANGCGYRAGKSLRTLPGGYEQVSVPVFENQTQEVAIEPFFTNALIEKFETSKIAKVVSDEVAPIQLKGRILQVRINRGAVVKGGKTTRLLNCLRGLHLLHPTALL